MTPLAAIDDRLADGLNELAGALRVPVLVLVAVVLVVCAYELGRFAIELARRRRGRRLLPALVARVVAEPGQARYLAGNAPTGIAARAVRQIAAAVAAGRPAAIEHALADFELAAQRRLDRTRVLVRAGPAVGLMGTLIPLAPGLAALGRGDVASLAADLRTAFAATVIGLLVGTVAFTLTLARTRFYTEDLAALERATEGLIR
jgi:biopolymer transport protein ExbB/TolQ